MAGLTDFLTAVAAVMVGLLIADGIMALARRCYNRPRRRP